MQPTDSFWTGLGGAVGNSPGWMVVVALLIVGVLFVWAKYVHPDMKEIKLRELEIREREAQNDTDRIKANAALAENMRALRESNDAMAHENAAIAAGIEESKTRSRGMGQEVDHIRTTTDHTAEQVEDLHRHFLREGS